MTVLLSPHDNQPIKLLYFHGLPGFFSEGAHLDGKKDTLLYKVMHPYETDTLLKEKHLFFFVRFSHHTCKISKSICWHFSFSSHASHHLHGQRRSLSHPYLYNIHFPPLYSTPLLRLSLSLFTMTMSLARILLVVQSAAGFAPHITENARRFQLDAAKVGIFFGTSTGSTETVADLITEEIGSDVADGPFDIETLEGTVQSNFEKYDALIVGTPTWNTGADIERSGTGWDELYYGSMQELDLSGKKVAVFGLGDQESYSENYADATGELHDVFESLGCSMMGYTSQDGYEHEASKSIRGDLFCGLLCDMVNQEDLTEGRVQNWVEQLKSEGFFDGGGGVATTINGAGAASAVEQQPPIIETVAAAEVETLSDLDEHSNLLDKTIEVHATPNGFTPYYNPQKKSTMWVSADGRNCYYTTDTVTKSVSP